ncbi:Calx-beta domain-containing protein [Candidatus Palauibacter sp.]|uniref:Calx-beta domain-containing protein n=1 Tax=Candidatus Palauibacter sp. TaxID=3101350 RepID=UPI003B5ADD0C
MKALASELPAKLGLPLSRFSRSELRRQVLAAGIVADISGVTIWRWLHEDTVRSWTRRSWIFRRDPEFATKAGRVLDLYHRRWRDRALKAGGVALALAALAGSHDSVRAQAVADSAGTTLSPPYSLTLAAVDGLAMWTRTAAGDLRADPGETIEIAPSRNTVMITRNTAVCDRTEQVRDAIVAAVPEVTDCADVTDAHLAAITKLSLRSGSIMALAAGDFAGLTSLETLLLGDNQLTSLPDGVFAGLASLERLDLSRNTTDPLPLAVTLEKAGESRFKAVAPTGAPFEFVLPVRAANGSIEGDSTAIRIPAGAVESGPLDITRAADTTAAVTVDIDSLPGLPSGHSGYALEKDSSLPQTILPSVSTGVTLSVSPDQVGEGDGATMLTVTATLNGIALTTDTAVALTVRALTADTTDFAASAATLAISSGQTSGTAELTLTPAGDDVDEGDETVAVEGAVAGLTVTADTVTITDDDTRGVDVSATALAVSEGDSATYTVALESAPTGTVTIGVSVTGDSDVTASPETLTFTADDWSTARTVTVRAAADDDAADDAATVSHAVSGGDYGANNVAADPVTVTVDDDVGNHPATGLPAISGTARVGDTLTASVGEIEDEDGLENVTFAYEWLSNDGVADTDIAGATDSIYTPIPADAGKTIKVRVTFTDGGGTQETRVSAATDPVTAAISSQLSVADAEATEEEDAAVEFVVTLTPAASDTVTVDYATADGTATAGEDYTATSGTLTFAAGDTTKTISVSITDDTLDDDGETFTLTLGNASSGVQLGDATATGTINDNDESLPTVSVSDASATEGDAVAFTVSLSATSSRQVTVDYATSDGTATSGTDFTAHSGTLTFATNETSKTVSVATTDDSVDEENETFTLALSSPANATLGDATATGTINDNDNAAPLTASFSDMPASHTGEEFTFGLTFSEEVEVGYVTLRDTAFAVTGGEVRQAQRQQQGSNQAWNITVEPTSANDTVTITLPETTDCDAVDAICTGDERPLSHSLSSVVAGAVSTPAVSVSDASAAEGDAVAFTVSLSATSSQQVTVAYATSGGTATSGTDFTAQSGTLTFAANETSKTVSVATTDDSVDEENETFTLTLSSPTNATLGSATATGTINDNDNAAPLTASFSDMPASHTGEQFTFGLAFSEEVELRYVTLRDTAFAVTGGAVKTAQRQQQGSNLAWNITVEPTSTNDTVIITLPETTDCGASDAICTHDGRPLSHSLSAKVVDAASSSASAAEGGDVVEDALALLGGVTPDAASAALFGEGGLSEAQLDALDRLGNRNGRYDLGDLLSWTERCRSGEARCGTTSTDPGPASSALLFGAAAAGRRRASGRTRRRGSGRRRARGACWLAVLLAAVTAWSCTADLVGPPAAEPDPGAPAVERPVPATAPQGPGLLTVEWTAPAASRAAGVLLELEGPGIEAVQAPGLELYQSSAPGRHQIVVAGSLDAGPLVRFRVPDRGRLAEYRVRVVQVTGEDYALSDVGEYGAVITSN